MSRLFISHSSKNDDWAIALKDWLVREGWSGPDDIFLDLDPDLGIAAGQRWVHALEDAATRCEAVLFLVSDEWLSSKWCSDEYQLANRLNKKLFALLVDDVPLDRLPGGLTAQWQIVRLFGQPAERFLTVHPLTQHPSPVHMATAALQSLKRGLQKAGIGADTFELQRDPNGPFGWRAPYRGLEALEPEDAAVFFGRSADTVRGIDMLRGLASRKPPRLLVILGASGAGKSSFLRAGLWPRLLRDDSQWLPLRAIRAGRGGAIEGSDGLLTALEEVHHRFAMPATRADLRDRVATAETFIPLLRELRQAAAKRALITEPPEPLPVLCLDQGEEVFAGSTPPETERFLKLARSAIDGDAALFLVTIRSDSYGAMQSAKALSGIAQVPLSLGPVPHGEIAHLIRGPAEILRHKVGPNAPIFDAAVIERLQSEVEGEEDALPLLAFVLQRLMREHQGKDVIGLNELERTGGVAEAIEQSAGEALDDAGIASDRTRQRDALRRLFIPRLARIDRESKTAQRRVARQNEVPADLLPLANALTRRRLLVVKLAGQLQDAAIADAATVEVAHEALLRRWPTLADLLAEDRDALLLLDGVLSAAADWEKAAPERKADFLAHRGSRLADAQALASRGVDWQREIAPAQNYLAACAARERAEREEREAALVREQAQVARTQKMQRRAGWALSAVFIAVLAALNFALLQSYETSKREAAVFASAGGLAFGQGFCDRALRLAVAGLPPREGASPLTYRSPDLQGELSQFASWHDCNFQALLIGHTNPVYAASFSPDGSRLLTGSDDKTARIWDVKTGALLLTLTGHTGYVVTAVYSPDGNRILTSSYDKTARLWDAKTGAPIATLTGHTDYVVSAAFNADGSRIVTGSWDHNARLWNGTTGAPIATLTGHTDYVNDAQFSPDGTLIVTASNDRTARIWNGTNGAPLAQLPGHTAAVESAAFSPDNSRVVTAAADGTARVWDAKTYMAVTTLTGHTQRVNSASYSPDGLHIITASYDKTAKLWNGKTNTLTATLSGHTDYVVAAAFSRDSNRVATASADGTARLWDVKTGALLATFSGHTGWVHSVQFSPDGASVATSSEDTTARVWHTTSGTQYIRLAGHGGYVFSAVFSPDGTLVATASNDSTARVWNSQSGAHLLSLIGHAGPVETAVFSPDGGRVLTASLDKTARIWNAKTGTVLMTLSGHTGGLNSAAFNTDGTRVVTAAEDNTARVWDATTGSTIATLTGHTDAVRDAEFSPDGARVVTASNDHTARLWNAKTGAAIATLSGDTNSVVTASFSRDGSRIVTASWDYTARVWDGQTGAPLLTLSGHRDAVKAAAFSPDGTRIATASDDKTGRLWDAKSGALIAVLQGDTAGVNSVAFSPDGNLLVTGSNDNSARVWDAHYGVELATLTGHTFWVRTAMFSSDGARVVTGSWDNTARVWQLDPIVAMPADRRQNSICSERLVGAQSFTTEEMGDPILRGRSDLLMPCDRVGPLSLAYYWHAVTGLFAVMHGGAAH